MMRLMLASVIGMSVLSSPAAEVRALRMRADALTARRAALRARLASLEAAGQATPQTRPLARPTGPEIMVLTAPFEVRDSAGQVIVRVQAHGPGGRGLFVMNEAGRVASQAAMNANAGGAIVAYDGKSAPGSASPHVGLFYASAGPFFDATRTTGKPLADIDALGFQAFDEAGVMPTAILDSGQWNTGGLQLADPNGRVLVMAGQWPGRPDYGLVTVGDVTARPLLPVVGAFARVPSFIRGRQQ